MIGRVLVAGLGLIGGSIALSIRRSHPQAVIMGYDINESEMEKAIVMNIVSEKADSFQKAAEQAELIILSTPVEETEINEKIIPYHIKKRGNDY